MKKGFVTSWSAVWGSRVVTLFNLEGIRLRGNGEMWGYSSAGRAPALQAGGRRFDPDYLHHDRREWEKTGL